MSYPFTKPVPRYGFRRRWGDPHVGLVGSGPGRPLRRYLTDPEVGVPQLGPGLTALGASPETPFTEGIFNVGPAPGFSRGVFTPDPPWATPRYIASTPDGVSGFGAFGIASCKRTKAQLIYWLTAKIASVPPFSQLPNLEVCVPYAGCTGINVKKLVMNGVQLGLAKLSDMAASGIISAAEKSVPELKGYMATQVIPQLTKNITAALPETVTQYISVTDVMLINLFNGFADSLVSWVQSCEEPKILDPSEYAAGSQPDGAACVSSSQCYSKKCLGGKCVNPVAQLQYLIEQQIIPQPKVAFPGMSESDILKMKLSQLTTAQAELQKCAGAGGEWFPGGAQCDVNPTTKRLENCRQPAPTYTGKRWTCVPKGTPGAVDPNKVAAGAAAAGTGKASNLPLILGAAAIAAFVLMR